MRKFLLFIALIISGVGFVNAQDVGDNTIIDYDGYSLQFTVTNAEPAECEVICSTNPATETAITIPSSVEINGVECSVTSIGDWAFAYFGLTSVEIPNSVTTIGNSAFSACYGLTSIEIPSSVTSIRNSAFSGCDAMEIMTVKADNTVYDSRENCNAIIDTETNTLVSGCKNTKIPNSVTSIGDYAFYYCYNLTSIEIPNSVTSIGDYAFYFCYNLTSIEIPNSVTSIGNEAFSWCSNLTTIKCHAESVPETYETAFDYCPSEMNIQVPEGSVDLYKSAEPWKNYNVTKMYPYQNGDNVVIDYEGYSLKFTIINVEPAECEVICSTRPTIETAITIPSSVIISGTECSVTTIGNSAFSACTGLTSIEIPNSVTSIGDLAFYSCSNLTSIEIPNSVTSIGDYAFYNCSGLTSIEIPNSVTSIGDQAFSWCSGLTSIEIPSSVTSIGNSAFSGCDAMEIMTVKADNTVYDSRENCNAIIDTETNTLVSGCKNTKIPNSVTSIGDYAFDYCYNLTSIEIPNSVTSIGDYAFDNCPGLTSIEIPNSVTTIGDNAFKNRSLLSIKCHAESVPETSTTAFDNCPSEMNIQVPEGSVDLYKSAEPWKNYNVTKMYPYQNGDNVVIDYEGYSLKFTIINVEPAECEVICSTKPTIETAITIPSSVEISGVECSVTSIGSDAFQSCRNLTSIEIPNSVTSIGDYAFYNCSGLTSIEIPNSVTSIGDQAFYNCSGLTSIEIPNSVTSIGDQAFYNCSGLTSIEIPNSVTSIGDYAFRYCDGLTSISVESGNPMYDSRNNCNAIIETSTNTLIFGYQNTIIPNSVTSIGDYAFYNCDGLTSIEIPNSVTTIGIQAFYSCSGLTSIEIPNSVTTIGNWAFAYSSLTSVEISNSVTTIGDLAFDCYSLLSIKCHSEDVPKTSTTAFDNCPSEMNIQVPEGSVDLYKSAEPWKNYNVTKMYPYQNGDNVVIDYEGYSLKFTIINVEPAECEVICSTRPTIETAITIPSSVEISGVECSVTSIGSAAFQSFRNLTSIEIPNSVTSIGDYAFYNCSGLTSIEIPNSVTTIGILAFHNCSGLTSIEIPNSVTSIGDYAFSWCSGLTSISVESGNPIYDSRNNCNAIIETSTNTLIFGSQNTIIPNSVTSIGDQAFSWCSGLTSIEIPNSVTTIGNSAFYNCYGLTSIEIPNSVTTIGNSAFYNCYGLTSIEIPNSVTTIGNSAFCDCTGLTSIEIPNSVTYIGLGAFDHCSNLTTIKCHAESVPETYESAFDYCPSDMTIQVPANSLSLYQAAEPWNNFNIVAGFNSNINVSSNITEGGFVEGGGNYQDGTEITVSAYVNPNYGFLYWSENDEIVSYSPNYSFIVSEDRKLVANFAINHWIPDYTIYPNFMAVTGVVQIDGIEQRDSNIEIGAFCGDELRGSNRLIYESEYDRYFLYLTIYGKDDDEISFRIYDNSEETELKLYYNETMNFIVDDIVGNVSDPKIFNFTTDYIHRQQLTSNWNWYSTFVDVSGREGFEMMTENLGEQAIQIKSQSVFSNYNAGKWNGGLNTVSTGNMYMIKMSEPIELSMSGVIVEPSEFPIVINPNWKWIPYPVQEEMDIASAFAGFTPNDGDIVKSQDGFTQYYQGIGWNGSLNTMMPGEGYMYQNTSGEEKILYYPTQGKNRNALKANVTTENNYWKPEVTKYPTNMNVIAVVNNSSEDYEIGAFCNGECRGSARPIYIEELDKHIVFMTVYGDEEETIYLKYYDINNDEEYAVSDVFTFSVNAVLGNTMNPYVISLVPANVGEISTDELNIYPNPAKVNDEIYFTKEYEKVEIYNALGVKIAEYENSDYIDGIEDAGVYVVKITDNGMSRYDRIIVK